MSGKSEKPEAIVQGQHLLADMFGIEDNKLNDLSFFTNLLKKLADVAHFTPANEPHITQNGSGCSGFLLMKDFHISFHTFPEAGYLAIDIFVGNAQDPEQVFSILMETFVPQMVRKTTIARGLQN